MVGINMTKLQQSLLSSEFLSPICTNIFCLAGYEYVRRLDTQQGEPENSVGRRSLGVKVLGHLSKFWCVGRTDCGHVSQERN